MNMHNLHQDLPLFQWRAAPASKPIPIVVRRVAIRARISNLHAAAFIEANGIGPRGAR